MGIGLGLRRVGPGAIGVLTQAPHIRSERAAPAAPSVHNRPSTKRPPANPRPSSTMGPAITECSTNPCHEEAETQLSRSPTPP